MNKGRRFPVEVLSKGEMERFLATFGKSKTAVRNKALVLVMYRGMLRVSEALDLRPCDLDMDRGSISVLLGKGKKRRVVGVDSGSLEVVERWMRLRPANAKYLFCTHRGGRMHDSYVRRFMYRHRNKSGIEKRIHPHCCRHSFAAHMADSKVDIRVISRALGHSSIAVTDRYVQHLSPGAVIDTMKSL